MRLEIPKPMKEEHEKFHDELKKAPTERGAVGEAAKALAKVPHPRSISS